MSSNTNVGMDVCVVDVSMLQVGKPIKVDHSLYGKVKYDGSSRMSVRLTGANVLSHRTMDADLLKYGILDVAVPAPLRRKLADMDDRMISLVCDNVPLWFAKGAVESSTIDDFYKRSIVTTSKGPAIRFKVQRDACLLANGGYDLVLRCRGLRFFKHVFILEWELVAATPVAPDHTAMFLDDAEDWDPSDGEGNEISPTWDQTRVMELAGSICSIREKLLEKQNLTSNSLLLLEDIERDLERMWPTNLDAIAARLVPLAELYPHHNGHT
jgi:hypothetical protein